MFTTVQKPLIVLILLCLIGILGANQRSNNEAATEPGWVVVQRDGSGNDTQAIQDAIEQVAESGGGRVLLPTGTWRHTGLIGRGGVHLPGTRAALERPLREQ